MKYIEDNGLTFIDAYYSDPMVYGGQGTIALEILGQDPDIDTIVCPIGGGGLITGIAVALIMSGGNIDADLLMRILNEPSF